MKIFHAAACLTVVSLICLSTLTGCSSGWNKSELTESTVSGDTETVTMSAVTNVYDTGVDSIELSITNNSDSDMTYGLEPQAEVLLDGVWYKLPLKEGVFWNDLAHIIFACSTGNYTYELSSMYGELPAGTYRCVKTFWADGAEYTGLFEFTVTEK